MISVLLTGSKQHGKDSTADFLDADHGYAKFALADPLRDEVATMLSHAAHGYRMLAGDSEVQWRKQLFTELKEQGPTKELLRGLLRWWGTEVRRAQDPDYWIKRTKGEIRVLGVGSFVISDVSFQNEMEAWPEALRVRVFDPRKPVNATEHASEAGRAELHVDYTLLNDGTLQDLRRKVDDLVEAMLSVQGTGGIGR